MRVILQHDLEMLKVLVLHKAKIQVLIPSLIKSLNAMIFSVARKPLSDTTLKRIFGFADTLHQPSLYTLNVLAEFCGYTSYEEFCRQQGMPANAKGRHAEEQNYLDRARLISEHTLQALKNKSGIPFNLTIPREFIAEHLEIFIQGGYTATAITAPAGYGKTIALCYVVLSILCLVVVLIHKLPG